MLNSAPEHGPSWGTDLYTAPGGQLLAPSVHPTLRCLPAAVGWGLTVSARGQMSASRQGIPVSASPRNGHVTQSGPVGQRAGPIRVCEHKPQSAEVAP